MQENKGFKASATQASPQNPKKTPRKPQEIFPKHFNKYRQISIEIRGYAMKRLDILVEMLHPVSEAKHPVPYPFNTLSDMMDAVRTHARFNEYIDGLATQKNQLMKVARAIFLERVKNRAAALGLTSTSTPDEVREALRKDKDSVGDFLSTISNRRG